MSNISNEDMRMLEYYMLERDSIESWSEWPKKRAIIFSEYPELAMALEAKETAHAMLRRVIKNIIAEH